LPIGEEPSGTSWTGLPSIGEQAGYLAVYREYNDRPRARLRLWDLAGTDVRCEATAGEGVDFTGVADEDGGLGSELPTRFTYALYR
jgi:alpha-galactosidase